MLTEVLVEAGLTLMMGAEGSTSLTPFRRARQFRDGLMVAMLALHPIRLKNFASLETGRNQLKAYPSFRRSLWSFGPRSKTP